MKFWKQFISVFEVCTVTFFKLKVKVVLSTTYVNLKMIDQNKIEVTYFNPKPH